MKPKGWRCDPAWVEHYSKIERERLEREMANVKLMIGLEMHRLETEAALRRLKTPMPCKIVA